MCSFILSNRKPNSQSPLWVVLIILAIKFHLIFYSLPACFGISQSNLHITVITKTDDHLRHKHRAAAIRHNPVSRWTCFFIRHIIVGKMPGNRAGAGSLLPPANWRSTTCDCTLRCYLPFIFIGDNTDWFFRNSQRWSGRWHLRSI